MKFLNGLPKDITMTELLRSLFGSLVVIFLSHRRAAKKRKRQIEKEENKEISNADLIKRIDHLENTITELLNKK